MADVSTLQPNPARLVSAKSYGIKLDVATLLSAPTKPIAWMIDDLIPEKAIGIVSGMSFLGKSYVGMETAIALASARPLFGSLKTARSYRVGYFDLEMMREDTERRFQRMLKMEPAGVDWSNLHIFAEAGIRIDDEREGSMEKFRGLINDLGLEIVIIDSLRRMHVGDDKDSKQANTIFNALKGIRDTMGCASMMIAHWRKTSADHGMNEPAERLAGSADYRNFVDVHISAIKHPTKDHLTIFPDKGRQGDGVPARFVVKFEHRDRSDKDGPFHLVMTDAPASEMSKEDRLFEALIAGNPLTIKDLSVRAKVNVKTAFRIVGKWKKTGEAIVSETTPMTVSPPTI